jgi:hypothetical protein
VGLGAVSLRRWTRKGDLGWCVGAVGVTGVQAGRCVTGLGMRNWRAGVRWRRARIGERRSAGADFERQYDLRELPVGPSARSTTAGFRGSSQGAARGSRCSRAASAATPLPSPRLHDWKLRGRSCVVGATRVQPRASPGTVFLETTRVPPPAAPPLPAAVSDESRVGRAADGAARADGSGASGSADAGDLIRCRCTQGLWC